MPSAIVAAGKAATSTPRLIRPVPILERGLALARKEGDRPSVVWGLSTLARALIASGRIARAQATLEELSRVSISSAKWQVGLLRAQLAAAQGDWAAAHRRFVEHFATYGFPERRVYWPHYAAYIVEASDAALRAGDPVAADSLSSQALRFARADGQDEKRSGVIGSALLASGQARLQLGDSARARDLLAQATGPLATGYGPEHRRTREARALLDSLTALASSSPE